MSDASRHNLRPGEMLAQLLRGAWRAQPPPCALTEAQTRAVIPLAVKGGCAGLAYRRLRHVPAFAAFAQETLRAEYVTNGLRAASWLYHLPLLVNALRDAGIEPILFKGWAIAQHYPELALRPMGDVDLFVPAAQLEHAARIVRGLQTEAFTVDLHTGTEDAEHSTHVKGRTLDDLYARSVTVPLGVTQVRVLSPEDHLHLLVMHFLRHGGWRPLWLCDIAVALETRPREFDWVRALGDPRTADWIACTAGAAHVLLDAQVDDTPFAARAKRIPPWLPRAILREWNDPDLLRHVRPTPLPRLKKDPRRWRKALSGRWVFNPIESSVKLGAPFNETPRVWYQARYWLKRSVTLIKRPR